MGDSIDVTVEISALASDGAGIGPIVGPIGPLVGKKVLVAGSIPGEVIETQLDAQQLSAGLASGRLVSITKTHVDRRTPPCLYVPECGGCALQHVAIETQRREKLRMVESLLLRQARLVPRIGYTLLGGALPEFEYRNRILLHLNLAGELGFYKSGTGTVVDIEKCLLAEPALNLLVAQVRDCTPQLKTRVAAIKFERRDSGFYILLKPRQRGDELDAEIAILRGCTATITHDQQDDSDAGHFSQVNTRANELLVGYVTEQFRAFTSSLAITEFYAGAGNFTFPLARAGFAIQAIEIDAQLTAAATARAQRDGLSQTITCITKSCEKFCKDGKISELVLLDPPRAGARIVAESISTATTRLIVYVSCNPATLARDLKIFIDKGFSLENVAVLDMFSQTAHVETIATLVAGVAVEN